jgi:hypothetical protein
MRWRPGTRWAHPLIGGRRQVEVSEQRTIDGQRPLASAPRLGGGAGRGEGGEIDAEKGETRQEAAAFHAPVLQLRLLLTQPGYQPVTARGELTFSGCWEPVHRSGDDQPRWQRGQGDRFVAEQLGASPAGRPAEQVTVEVVRLLVVVHPPADDRDHALGLGQRDTGMAAQLGDQSGIGPA